MLQIEYSSRSLEDFLRLSTHDQEVIKKSIEKKLGSYPELFSVRLRGSLADIWKLRVGDYRVGYIITGKILTIVAIGNRKDFYRKLERRFL